MSRRADLDSLADIREAASRILDYTRGADYGKFLDDIKTQDAILRNFEVIGEAAKNVSSEFKRQHKEVDWKNIAGFRDKLIHNYFGVNWDIVWNVIRQELPQLNSRIEQILFEAGR